MARIGRLGGSGFGVSRCGLVRCGLAGEARWGMFVYGKAGRGKSRYGFQKGEEYEWFTNGDIA